LEDKVVKFDPWQKLAQTGPLKDVPLSEVLKKLEVSSQEAPTVKREMLSKVQKITKVKR
jgi:hypothetical protein